MRKTISVISLLALLTASPAFAEEASKQEKIGVGAGSIIGAIVGGPVGFVIGAAIGAKVGDKMHQNSTTINMLTRSLDESRDDIADLEDAVVALTGALEHSRRFERPELLSLLEAGIAMDILFRTDEHVLADTTGERLAALAGSLAAMPDVLLQLDGFADERGDSDYNLTLSEKRVQFVRDQLVSAGVESSRIQVSAHGEAPAQDDSVDSYALERRVSLKLFIDESQYDAQPVAHFTH